jgi:hypothetical protein
MVRGTYHGNNYVIVACASQESERQHTDTLGSPVFECIRRNIFQFPVQQTVYLTLVPT